MQNTTITEVAEHDNQSTGPAGSIMMASTSGSSSSSSAGNNAPASMTLLNASLSDVSDHISRHRSDSIQSVASTIHLAPSGPSHKNPFENIVFNGRGSISSRPATPTNRKPSVSEDLFSTPPTLRKPRNVIPIPASHPDFQTCETVVIVPNADVALLVGQPTSPDRRKVLASSHILTIASPYFRALLTPDRFTEGIIFQQHKQIELQMFEDDPAAVIVVCGILHLQSRRIPPTLTGDQLAEVAIVLDKYDCVDAAWAWTRLWMSGDTAKVELEVESGRAGENGPASSFNLMITKDKDLLSKWLFIAWAFKDKTVFESCANALSWKLCEGEQDEDEFFQRLPESLQRDLIETRQACITTLHECTQGFIDKYVDPVCDVGIQSFYYRKQSPWDCDSRVLGTTLKGLREAELYPLSKIAKWNKPAEQLLADLRSVGRSIFGADEHHHDITPEMIFLEKLDTTREGMRKFKMDTYAT
ncbi:hypothetical protein ABW19_dt0208138 [Dactylella cylindrospora]|nr:hypothetical protein ABW19_dt0208138 [Dactylella cylindrospora]